MNLMKLFNLNYLKQNFKKSKVILSVFIGLIPILNTIILIMAFNTNNNYVLNFDEISIINFIGVYILPIIVSICLFNYVYKKKSVDFINSMPISRKSIFVTNTIFGMLIFLSMLIVNLILMALLTLIFNIPIPFAMMIDYLWFWFVIYIFAFSATNLAMTISGNAITQIVVTLLLFFLVPFLQFFTSVLFYEDTSSSVYLECDSNECIQEEYYCYDDLECNINKNANIYETKLENELRDSYLYYFEEGYGIDSVNIIQMLVLSIIYIVIGYFLFLKRKMEVSETSFKSIHIHNIVRSLTLVPIVALAYIICQTASIVSIIFVLIIILIYCFIYDLITKKSISNIKLSLAYFVFAICIITIFYSAIEKAGNKNTKETIKYSDIKEVAVDISYHISGYYNSNMDKIYIKNKELIELVVDNSFYNFESNDKIYYLKVSLKTNDNNKYSETISVTKEEYNKIVNIISESKDYVKYYKDIDFDKIYAIKIGNNLYKRSDATAVLKLVKDTLSNISLNELFELQKKYNNVEDDYYIKLYTYQNHDVQEFNVNGYISYDLLNSIVNSNNAILKKNISYIIPDDYYIYYSDMYTEEEYDVDYYILKNAKNDIYNFIIKELDNKVDMKDEFIKLTISIDKSVYTFTTNNVKGFKEILNNKYEEIKDTEEYKNYYNSHYESFDDLIEARKYNYDY